MTGKAPPKGPRALREQSGPTHASGSSGTNGVQDKMPPTMPRSMVNQNASQKIPTEPSAERTTPNNKLATAMLSTSRPPVQFNMLPRTVAKKSTTNPSRPPISIATKARLSAAAAASPPPPVQPPSPVTPLPPTHSPPPRESTPPPPPPEPDQSFLPSLTPPPLPEDEPPPAPPLPPDHLNNAADRPRFSIAAPTLVPKKSPGKRERSPVPLESATPKPPLDWPPPIDPDAPRNYRVIFDPAYHSPSDIYLADLLSHIKAHAPPEVVQDRIKGKPGKESIYRYNGEALLLEAGPSSFTERIPIPLDPRKQDGFKPRPPKRPHRNELYEFQWEFNEYSVGPPPPKAVLVTNLPLFASLAGVQNFFAPYTPRTCERQVNPKTGGSLGIARIELHSFQDANRLVVEKHEKRVQWAGGAIIPSTSKEHAPIQVVFDGNGKKLAALMAQLKGPKPKERTKDLSRPSGSQPGSSSSTPRPHSLPAKPKQDVDSSPPAQTNSVSSLPPRPGPSPTKVSLPNDNGLPDKPAPHSSEAGPPPIPESLRRARAMALESHKHVAPPPQASLPSQVKGKKRGLIRSTPPSSPERDRSRSRSRDRDRGRDGNRDRERRRRRSWSRDSRSPLPRYRSWRDRDDSRDHYRSSRRRSSTRSPSPRHAKRKGKTEDPDHEHILDQLHENGHEYLSIEGGVVYSRVEDAEILEYFEKFPVDKVLRDRRSLYVSFKTDVAAKRAQMCLSDTVSSKARRIAGCPPVFVVHPPPAHKSERNKAPPPEDPTLVIERAERTIMRELRELLEKDIEDRYVTPTIIKTAKKVKAQQLAEKAEERIVVDSPALDLKSISFKKTKPKQKKEVKEEVVVEEEPPKKKRKVASVVPAPPPAKKLPKKRVVVSDIESEDEDEVDTVVSTPPKRSLDAVVEPGDVEERPRKKKKLVDGKVLKDLPVAVVPELELPVVDIKMAELPPLRPPTLPEPPQPLQDEEDRYFTRLLLSGYEFEDATAASEDPGDDEESKLTFKKHITGSARTEGFYKITLAQKMAYVEQYQNRTTDTSTSQPEHPKPQQHVTSSRSNRADARRRAQGLDEINALNKAMALSKGETANATELGLKFNQLQTRKKHLRFAKSPIHAWGLYAMEKIAMREMVIEYVGEVIRAQVAEKREKAYERQGIGSSYLFRIDEDLVVDATKKGNLGRLINHSCDPNCTAKIITVNGEKKIVIYAKQDIELGDEITYDYHFPFEQDKIPCLCGSAKCRGFLN